MPLSERRVSRLSPEAAAALAFANNEPGADRLVLECIADATLCGHQVSVHFQKIANALIAHALLEGKLPAKAAGRRKEEFFALRNVELAFRYYELLDGGTHNPANEVAALSGAGARHVERAVSSYQWLIGKDAEERRRFRTWRASVSEEEYKAAVLVDLRLRDGRPVNDSPSGQEHLKKKASDMVKALRQELIDSMMEGPVEPPSILDEDPEVDED